jgi:hypothetical protein
LSGNVRYSSLISLALLVTPLLPLARVWAQAIGDRPVLKVNGSPDYATQDRYDFPEDQTGIRAGPFELLPSAAATVAYDSNVFASPAPHRESALSITQALVHVTSEPGGILNLDGAAYVRARRFTASSDQNTAEYGGSAAVDVDLSAQDELTGSILAQHRFEARTDIETPNIQRVSLYDEWLGNVSYAHAYNRLRMTYTLVGDQLDYADASQRYRDRSYYQGGFTAAYELPSGISIIATGYHSEDDYRFVTPNIAGGETTGAQLGVSLTIPEVIELEMTAGYLRRNFAKNLGEISGLSMRGSMVLYLTRLTTLRADLTRDDQPTRIPGAYGKIRTDALLEVGHAYSRSLNLYARARVVVDDFQTARRTDTTYLGEIGAFCEISRRFVLAAEYDFSERNSPVRSAGFLQHLMSVSLIGRL